MDKREILLSLQEMINKEKTEEKEEPRYTVESRQIDANNYLTLIAREKEESIITHPDYETFISLLKHHNTKEMNYVINKFNDNKAKIFKEYPDDEREKLLQDMRDLHYKLLNANQRNVAFVEIMIVDWVNQIFG